MRKILLYFALKYNGDYKKIYEAIQNKEIADKEELENIETKINCKYITIIDSNYPLYLRNISMPPLVLFYYGNINLLNINNKIAVIGKREATLYGEEMTKKIVKQLKNYKAIIVSGLANGIDSIAHETALENNIKTIAVLGSGIDYCYPSNNIGIYEKIKEKGLVVSEYPNNTPPKPYYFLIRNRIIAGLSEYICVIEANYKSGTMNTVAYGLEFGREICCVPTFADCSSGCNRLIKDGAKLIESAKDIYE